MMGTGARDLVTWVLGTSVTLGVIVGAGVRFVLMPYLREHLVEPMRDVKKQVTENHHTNRQPTVLDRIDDVQRDVKTLTRVLDGHIEAGDRWVGLIEREIDLVRGEAGLKRRGED